MTAYTTADASSAARMIGIAWADELFEIDDLVVGMNVESEHGSEHPETNVTGDDPVLTARIALAHLREFPDYYHRLREMEAEARRQTGNPLT